jgi:hypothetical protein
VGARRGARPPLWRERAAAAADRRSAVRPRSRRMQRATCNVDAHSTAERAAATAGGTHSATERSYTVGPVPYRLCPGSVAAAAARAPYCGLSKALRSCARVVPAQMWEGRAQSRRRCGRGEPSPGADVGGASPVPAQMWDGCTALCARCGSIPSDCRVHSSSLRGSGQA